MPTRTGADQDGPILCKLRADGKNSQVDFVAELREEIRARTGKDEAEVAFFDTTDIRTGAQWREVLSEAVSRSNICVCLCSHAYYSSEFCGKELKIFQKRCEGWRKAAGVVGERMPFVVPVIWQKTARSSAGFR